MLRRLCGRSAYLTSRLTLDQSRRTMEIEIGVVPQASVVRCLTVMRSRMEMQLLSELKCFTICAFSSETYSLSLIHI